MNQPIYLVVVILALFVLERAFPLRKAKHRQASRLLVNICVSALALVVAFWVVAPLAMDVLNLTVQHEWGLTPMLSSNATVQAICAFLLLDLSFYYWHRANHAWPVLWRFHNAHHIDPDLDVSTAARFHPIEIGYSSAFRAVQILIIGGPAWVFAAYEAVFQLSTLFHHSNLRIPLSLERLLVHVLVTPRMHGIHHSKVMHETNSNWSSVFSWWDRLHRTLRLNVNQSALDIGIAGYSQPRDNTVWSIIAMPFSAQRDYWRDECGSELTSRTEHPDNETRLLE